MFDIRLGLALEIVARVAIVYVVLLALLRLAGRRTMSDVTPMDMLAMLLLSETVSPAMTAGDHSVSVALIAAGTLVVLTFAASVVAFRSRLAERVMSGATAILIKDGHVDVEVLRRYRITDEDLQAALHQQGLLQVSSVARAFVESDGEITIVKAKDAEAGDQSS